MKTKSKKRKLIIVIRTMSDIKKIINDFVDHHKVPKPINDKIDILNTAILGDIFSKERMEIIEAIKNNHPKTIYQLAKILDRDFKNVSKDLELLVYFRIVELVPNLDSRKSIQPILKYDAYEIEFAS